MFDNITNFIFNNTPLFYLTQSIWRDEGFSYFMARGSVISIILNSIHDFNPPLYYILLHFWMMIFGESDIALRMMSFLFYVILVYYAFLLAQKIFSEKFAFFVAAFTFLNPTLIYYAFEIRMYSLFALFTMASMYYFVEKRWRAFTIVAVLGLYTHSFFSFVIVSYVFYLWLTKQLNKKLLIKTLKPFLFFLPWIPVLLYQFMQSANSWIFPVDMQLIKSSLGNLFINYSGTPGGLWVKTAVLSLVILVLVIFSIYRNRKMGLLFGSLIFVPLAIVLGYSVIRNPIYVNRYIISVTVAEIFAVSLAIWSIRNKIGRYLAIITALIFVVYVNSYASLRFHRKVDIRSTIMDIKKLSHKEDRVYAVSPLVYFESAFYYPDRSKVYIYNPHNIAIPNYIGTSVIDKSRSISFFPDEPVRTFLVKEDGSFETVINSER